MALNLLPISPELPRRTKNLEEAFQLLADGRNELLRVVKIGPDKRTHYWDSDKMGWVE